MLRSYIKIAVRNLFRYRTFSIINIFGLALSMSVSLLIISLIVGLGQYDRFHKNYKSIYRVLSKNSKESVYRATAPMPVREVLRKDYPGINEVVTFKRGFGGDASFEETSVPLFGYFCSDELFEVFSFRLTQGDPKLALRDPFSVILTNESALKLFGKENPIGKIIRFSERGLVVAGIPNKNKPVDLGDYTVKGVLQIPKGKTHLEFDILASLSTLPVLESQGKENTLAGNWEDMDQSYHYVLLENRLNDAHLESILNQISHKQPLMDENSSIFFQAQPLSKITPGKMYKNPFSYRLPVQVIYFLAILAAVVILSACFNYTNLSLAKSLSRAREVGIRKVSGAVKHQIFVQFIGESILISVLSLAVAIGIFRFLQPAFNSLWFTRYVHVDMSGNISIYLIFLAFSVLIGMMAGMIPALYLSSFKPLKVLKEIRGIKIFKRVTLRKSLIVMQFATSLFFIITTLLIYYQLRYMTHSEYGFNKENIINVSLQGNNYDSYVNLIKNHSGIDRVSGSSVVLTTGGTSYTFLKRANDPADSTGMSEMYADRDFIENLGLTILAGTNFPDDPLKKTESGFLVNETAAKKLGYDNPQDLVGESFLVAGLSESQQVAGVIRDFHYASLAQEIGPFIIRNNVEKFRYANIRILTEDQETLLDYLEQKWKELDNDHAFESQFMDQQLQESSAIFGDIGYIIGFISFLAISIACLGLLGMVIFVVQTRIKEIGIRKVHGATNCDAVWVLSKGFLIMLGIAVIIATPLAKLINDLWLREFAVRIQFGMGIMATGILIMLALGLATIFSQTIKSAHNNPVEALRYE